MKTCALVGCGVVLLILVIGGSDLLFFGASRAVMVVDTRSMLGHPAASVPGYAMAAQSATERLAQVAEGLQLRYLELERSHTQRVTNVPPDRIAEARVSPFPDEIAAIESDMWGLLTRELDPATVEVLRKGGYQYDAFPYGRDEYHLTLDREGDSARTLVVRRPRAMRQNTGALRLPEGISRVLGQ